MISKTVYKNFLICLFLLFACSIGVATNSFYFGISAFLLCLILRVPKIRELYPTVLNDER